MAKKGENITKRKDGRWEARILVGYNEKGRALYKSLYAKSYSEVKIKKLEYLTLFNMADEKRDKSSDVFDVVLSLFLQYKKYQVKESTFACYTNIINKHIRPKLGWMKIANIDSVILESFINGKLNNGRIDRLGGLSTKMVKDILTVLSLVLKYANKIGLMNTNQIHYSQPKVEKEEIEIFSIDEEIRITNFAVTNGDYQKFGVCLALYTGLRIGELCALRWKNIDLDNSLIFVKNTLMRITDTDQSSKKKTKIIMDSPKTVAGKRAIPIPSFLLPKLQELYGENKNDNDFFLTGTTKYGRYFVDEVSDAYLVCLLLYAMENDYDLSFEGALSEDLYIQINEYLMPAIAKNIKNYKRINIETPSLLNLKFEPNLVATGISCGVDSFYTVLKNMKYSQESGRNINALTFFNAGASGEYGGEKARKLYEERIKLVRHVAKELNCAFITVDSNMNEFLMQNHEQTHVFRTLAIPLALQKLFKIYYFSSGMEYNKFSFEFFDPAFYDVLTMPLLSTRNTNFILVGGETTRLGKVEFIADSEIVRKNLNVCVVEANNCGKCIKCKRTMLNLYILNKLEEFSSVFDINYFYKNKRRIIRWAVYKRKGIDMDEIVVALKQRKEIYFFDYIYAILARVYLRLRRVVRRIKNILKRG